MLSDSDADCILVDLAARIDDLAEEANELGGTPSLFRVKLFSLSGSGSAVGLPFPSVSINCKRFLGMIYNGYFGTMTSFAKFDFGIN
ncbi:hypothetical protein C2S52_000645, partial [Perilla frutescens var. hirtella]